MDPRKKGAGIGRGRGRGSFFTEPEDSHVGQASSGASSPLRSQPGQFDPVEPAPQGRRASPTPSESSEISFLSSTESVSSVETIRSDGGPIRSLPSFPPSSSETESESISSDNTSSLSEGFYYPSINRAAGRDESIPRPLPQMPIEEDQLPGRMAALETGNRGRARGRGVALMGDGDSSTQRTSGSNELGSGSASRQINTGSGSAGHGQGAAAVEVPVAPEPVPPIVTANMPIEPPPVKAVAPAREPVVKRGDKGDTVPIACNFLRLVYHDTKRIQEYHVDFEPQLDNTKSRRKALDQFEKELGDIKNFDGTMLFLPFRLPENKTKLVGIHPGDSEQSIAAHITYVKEREAKDLMQFFNILFRRIMRKLEKVELRRNFYDLREVRMLDQHKLEIWPGYCIAIEEREGGLMLCLDASHRVLRTDTVYDFYSALKETKPKWKEEYTEFIIGKIVLTRYNTMCYKIDDIMWDTTAGSTFTRRGDEISYVKYYKEHHNQVIKDMNQPLLLSRVKPRKFDPVQEDKLVALVPELCYITGLTDEQRSNFTVMKDLGEHTRLQPAQRKLALDKFTMNINKHEEAKKILSDWNLELASSSVHMQARQITAPKLNFGKKGDVNVTADFNREATTSCYEPRAIKGFLVVCTQRDTDKARRFCETYRQVAGQLSIPMGAGQTILPLKGYQVNDFRRAIKDNLNDQYQFVIVIMPQQRDDVYSAIKKTCVSEIGVPSQCVLTKTLSNEKRLRSVVQKIALQINCKLGGSLWALNMPVSDKIMFVGIDVAHDAKRKNPSVLALVANLNNECTKYFSVCRIQKVHQEIADILQSAFTEALDSFAQYAGGMPDRVVVWRDGGTVSSMQEFMNHEVLQMLNSLQKACPLTKFSFVVIQKRISQRFFKTDRMGKNWANPDPGTIIDHTVTNRFHYDFYVVSQLVRQGTVTPTHYIVVHDTHDTKPDLMQKFAYATSFMYFNWPGTIRVPAMTQYAHKLAGLVGSYVRAPPDMALVKTLYYL